MLRIGEMFTMLRVFWVFPPRPKTQKKKTKKKERQKQKIA